MNFFFILSTLVILFSTIMVFLKTPINSTLCLCSILILSIITLFLFNVEFISYIFILVYVGGLLLLFLFVIIMLNLTIESITKTTDFKLLSGPSILFLLILKLQAFISTYVHFFSAVPVSNESYLAIKKHHYLANDILNFSNLLYNHFFFFFLIIGVILLLAMLGVLVLSLNISSSRILKISKNKSIDLTYIPTENYIGFSLIIFFLSMLGVSINKQKNFLIIMLFFELMLFSLSLLCVVISVQFYGPQGQLFALFIMAIAVSESSIGLGILIVLFRINKKLDFNNFSTLKC